MSDLVNVKVVEDNSVDRALNKFAEKLNKKYNKKRKIDERLLRKKTPFERIAGAFVNIVSALLFVFCVIFCFSAVYSKINNIPPSIGGYFCMRVSSGSMVNSGFDIGRDVIVRSVDTKTLNQNDIIAFYVDYSHYTSEISKLTKLETTNTQTKYKLGFLQFFGVQSKDLQTAAQKKSLLVFHHIKNIYIDKDGNRYFSTYGSSNTDSEGNISNDIWLVPENDIVGIYDNSSFSNFVAVALTTVSSPLGVFIILLIPMLILIYSLIMRALKNVQLAMLENDVVEEKRKLTDPICLDNEIGFKMDTTTKYKVLAQAPDDKKLEYVNLLWKNGDRPEIVRKYYLRKDLIIKPNEKLLNLNRACEQMFKDNVEPTKIAKYYQEEKAKIEAEQKQYKDRVVKVGKLKKQTEEEEREEARIKVKLKATKNLSEMQKIANRTLASDKKQATDNQQENTQTKSIATSKKQTSNKTKTAAKNTTKNSNKTSAKSKTTKSKSTAAKSVGTANKAKSTDKTKASKARTGVKSAK